LNCTIQHDHAPRYTEETRAREQTRGSAAKRGYNRKWQEYRAWFIRQATCSVCGRNHALCEGECKKRGQVKPAYAVDHIVPHRGDSELFWTHNNHQSLCQAEHNAKSNRERIRK
jgi:5-methylcytosine-specific restriction enzyme A